MSKSSGPKKNKPKHIKQQLVIPTAQNKRTTHSLSFDVFLKDFNSKNRNVNNNDPMPTLAQQISTMTMSESKTQAQEFKEQININERVLNTIAIEPINVIQIPAKTKFILQSLQRANIEFYIVGGYVRNRLMGIPPQEAEDIDIMVNCLPGQLPEDLKMCCEPNTFQPKQWKMDNLDFWCEPWDSLKIALKKRDFLLNTFIANLNGQVFDMLEAKSELESEFVRFIQQDSIELGILLEKEPSLILRLIRFCSQFKRLVHEDDLPIVKANSQHIRNLPKGIILSNLQELFLSPYAHYNLAKIVKFELLEQIIVSKYGCKPSKLLKKFWRTTLTEWQNNKHSITYYHILALLLLAPLLTNAEQEPKLETNLNMVMDDFFIHYPNWNEIEKNVISKSMKSILLAPQGLYVQFAEYEAKLKPSIQGELSAFSPVYLPTYQAFQQQPELNQNINLNTYRKKTAYK